MGSIKDSLTFDDVSLVPQQSSVFPQRNQHKNHFAQKTEFEDPTDFICNGYCNRV